MFVNSRHLFKFLGLASDSDIDFGADLFVFVVIRQLSCFNFNNQSFLVAKAGFHFSSV